MSFKTVNRGFKNSPVPAGDAQPLFVQNPSVTEAETKPNKPANVLVIQTKLTVGAPDDMYEKEADAVADKVIRMPEPAFVNRKSAGIKSHPILQRQTEEEEEPIQMKGNESGGFIQKKCAECEKEKGEIQRKPVRETITPLLQRKSERDSAVPNSMAHSITSSNGSGEALDANTQNFMSSRFGNDFSSVKIHSDNQSVQFNRELNAKAFTVGKDIYFNEGQYQPNTDKGKHLLAHELTHVVQQNHFLSRQRLIQKAPSPVDAIEKEAAKLETDILSDPKFTGLKAESKDRVKRIIAKANTMAVGTAKGQKNYYLKKLKEAILTPFNGTETGKAEYGCSEDAEKTNRKAVENALKIEKQWWEGTFEDVEEKAVASGTNKTAKKGEGGKKYYVDRTDPRNIRVLIKVKLKGKAEEVESIKKLEDAIERDSHTKGYYLDIVFVNTSGDDVFEFTVSFCQWANSGNWASGPTTLSHEVHHALGLADRYDYIESHAGNPQMNVPMRLYWFEEQMKKTTGPRDPFSKMAVNSKTLLSEDVCAIAFESAAEQKKCIDSRKDLDPAGIPAL